jgi:hypothetical protein
MPLNFPDKPARTLCVVLITTLCLVLAAGVPAQEPIERQGYFEVRSASTSLVNGVHLLDARLQLVLSSDALEALNSGVPLIIELQLQVIRVRRLYLDAIDAELTVRFELEYRPLSQRFLVRNLNSGEQSIAIFFLSRGIINKNILYKEGSSGSCLLVINLFASIILLISTLTK